MTRRHASARTAAAVLALATSGCVRIHAPGFTAPPPRRAWPSTFAEAHDRANEGKLDAADSILADFAARFPGSPEALETAYWRALFKLDPANQRQSIQAAMASLDAYMDDTRPRQHIPEAVSLRRIASQIDGLSKLAANAMARADAATATASNAKAAAADAKAQADARAGAAKSEPASSDAEVKRLKDELAKANAELERIKKRLSQPPPKP